MSIHSTQVTLLLAAHMVPSAWEISALCLPAPTLETLSRVNCWILPEISTQIKLDCFIAYLIIALLSKETCLWKRSTVEQFNSLLEFLEKVSKGNSFSLQTTKFPDTPERSLLSLCIFGWRQTSSPRGFSFFFLPHLCLCISLWLSGSEDNLVLWVL